MLKMTKVAAGLYEVTDPHDAEVRFRVSKADPAYLRDFGRQDRPWVVTNAAVGGSWGFYPVAELPTLAAAREYFGIRKAAGL